MLSKLGISGAGTSGPLQSGNPTSRGFSNIGPSKQSRGNFSLKTFIQKDKESDGDIREDDVPRLRPSDSDAKVASTWRVGQGDSEEELNERPKDRVWVDRQYEVTVSSGGHRAN